jgi:hypothetical protein
MLGELLTLYLESVTAFWRSLAKVGLWPLILIGLAIWWFVWRKGRWCCSCSVCGCRCGCCRCKDEEEIEVVEAEEVDEGAGEEK